MLITIVKFFYYYFSNVVRNEMKLTSLYIILLCLVIAIIIENVNGSVCGCKSLRKCYSTMLSELKQEGEASCLEDVGIGTATLLLYFKALPLYCGKYVKVNYNQTIVGRKIYEVVISDPDNSTQEDNTIIIDAGQEAGVEAVELAMVLIQQLVACSENDEMISKVKWVIIPNANPDGMEYARRVPYWKKNNQYVNDRTGFGVDISRNFNSHWALCEVDSNTIFTETFRGEEAESTIETIFITNILNKYQNKTKLYLSIRRDGHYIGYPYSYTHESVKNLETHKKIASEIASKVNLRASTVNLFMNDSIYNFEGDARCGHSVDYAIDIGIPLAFEMRVFFKSVNAITSLFHLPPPGHDASLRNGYLIGIKEFYKVVANPKRYNIVYTK